MAEFDSNDLKQTIEELHANMQAGKNAEHLLQQALGVLTKCAETFDRMQASQRDVAKSIRRLEGEIGYSNERSDAILYSMQALLKTALPEGTPWLFPSLRSRSGHTVEIRKPFRRVVQGAGLDPYEVIRHTMRHTAITRIVHAGIDLPTVKRISGHKTLIMVERYAHQNGTHIQAAMDALEARYALQPLPTAQRGERCTCLTRLHQNYTRRTKGLQIYLCKPLIL